MEEKKPTQAISFSKAIKGLVEQTNMEVENLTQKGELVLPQNYSAGNALKQFQLMIQDDDKIKACTQTSIAKCMLDMVIMGLNPSKKQVYCVPYGNKATLMPSYLGNVAMAKRIDPTIADVKAHTVHKGEDFGFEEDLESGYFRITKHKRTLDTMAVNDPDKDIVGAYATITYNDNKPSISLVMPYSEIKKRWAKSQVHPIDGNGNVKPNSTHFQFPDRMCERTVINAICVPIIAKSDDTDLFGETLQGVSLEANKMEAEMEAEEKMCSEDLIDIDVDVKEIESEEENNVIYDKTIDIQQTV